MNCKLWFLTAATAASVLLSGCASPGNTSGPNRSSYRQDKDVYKVWMTKGATFAGYDTVYVADTGATIAPLRENSQAFDLMKRSVQDEFAAALQEKRLFQNVVTRTNDIKPDAKVLKLETQITEFRESGNGAPPVISVYGKMLDNARTVFQFDGRRVSDSRHVGVADVRTMAKSIAEFIQRSAETSRR